MPDLNEYNLINSILDPLKHHMVSSQNVSHNFPSTVTEKEIRDSLLYFLLSFNTTQICEDENEGFLINPNFPNHAIIYPFTNLAFSHRKVIRFIKKMNYGGSNIKSVICEYLIGRVDIYQKVVVTLFECEIEEIFIRLSNYIEEFKEYSDLVDSIDDLEGVAIFNILVCKYERGLLYYEGVIEGIKCIINDDVLKWCTQGEAGSNGIIIENKTPLQFDESYYRNAFELNEEIPKFIQSKAKKIFVCGLMRNIMRKYNQNLALEECNGCIDEIFVKVESTYNSHVGNLIKKYISEVYNKYFIRESTWIIDLFDTLGNKVFIDFDTAMSDFSKAFNKYEFKSAEARINHYILKILSTEKFTENTRLNIFENLLVVNNNELFNVFFSSKVIFELEIIFRFLYQLFVFEYFYTRLHKNNFVIKARTFLQYYRSTVYLNYIDAFQQVINSEENEIVTKFEEFIKYILKQLYFTQMPIFKNIGEIFDLLFEYIYVKGDDGMYLRALDECLAKIKIELEKSGSTPEFLFYLDILRQ